MAPNPLGFKGRIARMLLNFLDEHGNYRESLEETAARAAAAEANSLLARDRRGRKKGRRSSRNDKSILDGDPYDDYEEDLLKLAANNNGLPEDPYEQIQFYYQTFKSRSTEHLRSRLQSYQLSTTNWIHHQLHHDQQINYTSLLILLITTLSYIARRRLRMIQRYRRIHSILGKKFHWRSMYLHSNFVRGVICHQIHPQNKAVLENMEKKAEKAELAALAAMRPYQRYKYERFLRLETFGNAIVTWVLILGIVTSGMTFCMTLYNLIIHGGTTTATMAARGDGYIYSLDGPTDSDGYPIHHYLRQQVAEQKYAECIVTAEAGGNDPNEVCDLNSFFHDDVDDEGGAAAASGMSGVLRSKVNALLMNYIGIPSTLSTYLTSLPSRTLAYLSSLFTLCLFVLSHYISHKIHLATMSNDPMKHFVIADATVKADGTVEAKKGETEAQRKKRERMLQMERYKAQMAQLAQEAKAKAQERIARLEGEEAAKREEEEREKKVMEEQDETVKLYGRQFMMIKCCVPDGAIINSLLPMGIEEEEARGVLVKLREVKARREEEAKKAEEEEAKKLEEEKRVEEMKERIASNRLKRMKSQGSEFSGGSPLHMGSPPATAAAARKVSKAKSPKKMKLTQKTEQEKAEEAKKIEAMKERIAAKENTPGLKVAQPWASPAKKEKTSPKNKRWDKVTKSWVDRDLETGGVDTVPSSVVLKNDVLGANEEEIISAAEVEFKVFVPMHKSADESVKYPEKADPTAHQTAMMSQSCEKSPDESTSNNEFKAFAPVHISPKRRLSSDAATNAFRVDENKYDAEEFNPVSLKEERNNTEKSELTKLSTPASSQSSSPPPILMRVTESPGLDDPFAPQAFEDPSAWSRRSTARDIQAMIEAVESTPDDKAQELFLGPNSLHSPAFEAAMRASEASWDRRPSSRDIMAKIHAAEQHEAKIEEDKALRRSTKSKSKMIRIDEGKDMVAADSPTGSVDPKIGSSLLRKSRSQGGINSDDEISEISMHDELSVASATFSASTPVQMRKHRVRMSENDVGVSEQSDAPKTKNQGSESERGTTAQNSAANSESATATKEETEEEKQRRKKAEERAKKFEAMNDRRRKGKGNDDGTAVSGISKRQRIRRKKSALAAITPDEKERNEWKKGIFASVLNVEREKWKTSIYSHVINVEETRADNIKVQKDIEELNAAAQRRVENQKRLDAKAKKFAARAEKFHMLRRDDDGSVVSSASRLRRRRTRKAGGNNTPLSPPREAELPSAVARTEEKSALPHSPIEPTLEDESAIQNETYLAKKKESQQRKITALIKENENVVSTENADNLDQCHDESRDIFEGKVTSTNASKNEEKKVEPDSENPPPQSPLIGAIKNIKSRRRASPKKTKKTSSN